MDRTADKPDRWSRGYVNGVLDLAALCSDWIGCSSITAMLYAKPDWIAVFSRDYRIKKTVTVQASEETFKQTLVQWLGSTDRKLTDEVIALLEHELGPAQAVYRADAEEALIRALSSSERGYGAYYTTEDVFFVEFPDCVLALIMGNNE